MLFCGTPPGDKNMMSVSRKNFASVLLGLSLTMVLRKEQMCYYYLLFKNERLWTRIVSFLKKYARNTLLTC